MGFVILAGFLKSENSQVIHNSLANIKPSLFSWKLNSIQEVIVIKIHFFSPILQKTVCTQIKLYYFFTGNPSQKIHAGIVANPQLSFLIWLFCI